MSRSPARLRAIRAVLRVLSLIAPATQRERWLREWEGELDHWSREREARSKGRAAPWTEILLRLLPAVRDTFSVRALAARGTTTPFAMIPRLLQDLRFGARSLRKVPFFSSITVFTLAIGIGGSLAVFGLLNAVLIRPLPFPASHRLVMGQATFEGEINPWASGADFFDYRERATLLEGLAAVMPFPMDQSLTGDGEPERVRSITASVDLLPVLGVQPSFGRAFSWEEGTAGAPEVVLLSHGFWQRRYGGDPGLVGSAIILDGQPFTVVGVLPQGFHFLTSTDVWHPMRPDRDMAQARDRHNWLLVGRLGQGVPLEQAQAQIDAISAGLAEAHPESNRVKGLLLSDLQETLVDGFRLRLGLLSGAATLLLLLACGNAAGILLARAPARRFELSIRSALGAGRGRLIRQLLTEATLLGLAGGTLGILLAFGFQRALLGYLAMDQLGISRVTFTLPTLTAALALSLAAGLAAGAYPALKGSGGSPARDLKEGERALGGGGTGFRSGLVVAQVALSMILLVGSGLLVRSLAKLEAVDPGFTSSNTLTGIIQLPRSKYPGGVERTQFFSSLQEDLRAIPGVEAVGLVSHLPIADRGNVFRARLPGEEGEGRRVFLRGVFPGYFETLRIPLLSGRGLAPVDNAESARVAVVSEAAARALFGGKNPLGREFQLDLFGEPRTLQVVGVAGDVRMSGLETDPELALYLPYAQNSTGSLRFALRGRSDWATMVPQVKSAVWNLDPDLPIGRMASLDDLLAESVSSRRALTLALTLFALLPLLLAAAGLYAVLAYHVARRSHELGIRVALGAEPLRVGGMVVRQGLSLVWAGVALGLAGALAVTRFLRQELFGVEPTDATTFLAVTTGVILVAVLACTVPAWRALRSDPREALNAS